MKVVVQVKLSRPKLCDRLKWIKIDYNFIFYPTLYRSAQLKPLESRIAHLFHYPEKRKAVSYRKFLREKYQERRFKKTTKPSKTRWSFYKDVLEGILSQQGEVEAFLKQDGDFIRTRPGSFRLSDVASQTSLDYFSNHFVHMHFKFALSILKKNWCHERRSTRTVHAFTRRLVINKSFETVILRLSQSNEKWRFQRFRFYRLGKPR